MKVWNRVRAFVTTARLERELAEEIEGHRRLLEQQFVRDGLGPAEARLAANRRLGNAGVALERGREVWRVQWIDSVWQDVTFALRLLRRQPLLTAAAVITIALGVGANTAVTSVLETALLNPLGLRDTRGVMVATVSIEKIHLRNAETSAVEFAELTAMRDTFATTAAFEGRWWTAESGGQPARLVGSAVTPDFFHVFNERPRLGRFFTGDDRESVVLSYALWQAWFGGDPSAVGRTLMLDGKPHRIVGVAPERFRMPGRDAYRDAWTPLVIAPARFQRRGWSMNLTVFLRRKDTVTEAQAVDRVNRHVAAFKASEAGREMKEYGYAIDLRPFAHYVAGDLRRPILILWAAALLVLVTGCANVAGLLLARSAGRKREIAIRFSLGASGLRVLRQLLVESLVLGVIGGAAGVAAAEAGAALARRITIPGGAMLSLVHLDGRLILYALAIATATALVFGLAPAMQLLRRDQASALVRSRRRFQNVFVVAEVAMASLLLVVAALLVRSLWAVERVQPGFNPAGVTTAFVIKSPNDPAFPDRLAVQVRAAAGVESAALAYPLPFTSGGLTSGFEIRNREQRAGEPEWHGEAYMISPGYLRTLGIPLLRGRDLTDADGANAPVVCLIDSVFAQRFFPGQDPLGQEIAMYKGWAHIVGVVAPVRGTALEGLARPVVYYSLAQVPFFPSVAVIVRSKIAAVPIIRGAVRLTDPRVPVFDVRTMEERIGRSLGVRRLLVDLLGAFAAITVLLSAIGLHSVVAQVVSERTPEIGMRMALGARPAQVLRHFLGQGLRAGVAGLAIGLAAVSYAQRWIVSFLFGIQPFDTATFAVASAALLFLLAFAVWWPARRAAAIDPQVALRYE
jgi:putative ABC transport system permease protein